MLDNKKWYFILVLALVIVITISLFFMILLTQKHETPTISNADKTTIEQEARERKRGEEMALLESKNWPVYRNERLGFELKYPPRVQTGDVVFFQAGHIVFVTTSSTDLFRHRQELARYQDDTTILARAKVIQEKENDPTPGTWTIWVRAARNDADLSRFIDASFGKVYPGGCKLGGKKASTQSGVYNVAIVAIKPSHDGSSDGDSSCFINWMMSFKYSPTYQRAAMWDIGQEPKFSLLSFTTSSFAFADAYVADFIMADSFRFISKK